MSVSSTAIASMDYVWLGQPFVRHAPKSTVATGELDYSFLGQPFVATDSGGAIIEADATVTATATASFDSQTATVISSDSASTCALSTAWDSQTLTIVESDSSSACALSTAWDGQELTVVASDASATAALSVSWDGVGRLMSSADATSTLTLTSSFDSAFSTVVGSTWSVIINQAVGPVVSFTVASGGSGYTAGQQISLNGANNDCVLTVAATFPGGVINSLTLNAAGTGYSVGTYSTTRLTPGPSGSGCMVTVSAVDANVVLWISGATKGSVWSPAPALTPTWHSLSFAATTSSTTASVTADMVSGATAGVVATTTDAAIVDWQGIAIGPVAVDFSTVLECVAAWSGQRLISTVKETVRVGRTLTETLKVGRSAEGIARAGE